MGVYLWYIYIPNLTPTWNCCAVIMINRKRKHNFCTVAMLLQILLSTKILRSWRLHIFPVLSAICYYLTTHNCRPPTPRLTNFRVSLIISTDCIKLRSAMSVCPLMWRRLHQVLVWVGRPEGSRVEPEGQHTEYDRLINLYNGPLAWMPVQCPLTTVGWGALRSAV